MYWPIRASQCSRDFIILNNLSSYFTFSPLLSFSEEMRSSGTTSSSGEMSWQEPLSIPVVMVSYFPVGRNPLGSYFFQEHTVPRERPECPYYLGRILDWFLPGSLKKRGRVYEREQNGALLIKQNIGTVLRHKGMLGIIPWLVYTQEIPQKDEGCFFCCCFLFKVYLFSDNII